MKLRGLDLFCGAGGCTVGYERAGILMVGVDIEEHADYPGLMLRMDWREALERMGGKVDFVHASPPCQAYTPLGGDDNPDLLGDVIEALEDWGGPFVVENVPRAPFGGLPTVQVCGSSFGLRVRRHRLFGSNLPLVSSECRHAEQGQPLGVYGQLTNPVHSARKPRGLKAQGLAEASDAMGIDWMNAKDIVEAIPPAYTEFIGAQILRHLEVAA